MGYDTKKQLKDRDNNLIAQLFDELLDDFRPLLGDEHGTYMQDVQAKAVLDQMLVRLTELPDDAKAEAIRVLLATMEGRQGQIKSTVDAIAGKDFATQGTLAAVKSELAAVKTNQLSGDAKVTLSGSFASIKSAPVAGAKTVTTTAAEIFAGASRLANRYTLLINNEAGIPIYIGTSGVTAASGYPVLPGDSLALTLSPAVATAIYAISTGSAAVRILEVA